MRKDASARMLVASFVMVRDKHRSSLLAVVGVLSSALLLNCGSTDATDDSPISNPRAEDPPSSEGSSGPGASSHGGGGTGATGNANPPEKPKPTPRLHASGRHFAQPDGTTFRWRFVSFFGGIDLVAD